MKFKDNLKFVGKQLLLVIVIALILCLVFAAGLMVGYGVIGGGDDIWSILSPDKWQELISKFTGK